MQITLKSIEFRYGKQKLVEVSADVILPALLHQRRASRMVHTTNMVRANFAIFRFSIDKFSGDENSEPVIEVTVPFNDDIGQTALLVKAELIRLGQSINSAEMDFGALDRDRARIVPPVAEKE